MAGLPREATNSVWGIIVTYNPPPSLYESVLAIRGQVATVLVVDNASSPECGAVLERIRELPDTEIMRNPRNIGVGAALNLGVRRAIELGYPWVMTFDQDSRAGAGFVTRMLGVYSQHPSRATIGLVAPRYREESSGLLHDQLREDAAESAIVRSTMMSGNLVRTDVISQVGFYDEQFFIDYVDHEFCLRMTQHGFRVLQSRDAILDHNLGRMSRKAVAGHTFATTNHSPLRRYYNARNRTLVYRRYGRFAPKWVARDLKSFLVETAKILLLEDQRGAKLTSIAKGVWHGLASKVEPAETSSVDHGTSGSLP